MTVNAIPGAQRSVSRGFRDGDAGTQTVDPTLYDPIAGQATLHVAPTSLDIRGTVQGCEPFLKGYPLRIHSGTSCHDPKALGPEWGPADAGAEALVYCNGTSGTGSTYYSRLDTDPRSWTLGGPPSTNVLGHVLVIHDPVSDAPLACGEIPSSLTSTPDAGRSPTIPLNLAADLAGYCMFAALAPDASPQCPDPKGFVDCATDHCGLTECLGPCSDYLTCLKTEPDPCSPAHCMMDTACGACTGGFFQCLVGFCLDQVGCGQVTPGGPCGELEACCTIQGDYEAACDRSVHQLEKLSGDPSCLGATMDWDWNTHVPVPCNYDQ